MSNIRLGQRIRLKSEVYGKITTDSWGKCTIIEVGPSYFVFKGENGLKSGRFSLMDADRFVLVKANVKVNLRNGKIYG